MNILPLVYLGNIQYYTKLCFSECVIDVHEHFVKQSYRNRCDILGANGPMALTVPMVKMDNERKCSVKDTRIDYSKRWQHQHWQSIRSAYIGSPYFDFYAEELAPFYVKKYDFLLDFDLELTRLMLRWLGSDREPVVSEGYIFPLGADTDRKEDGSGSAVGGVGDRGNDMRTDERENCGSGTVASGVLKQARRGGACDREGAHPSWDSVADYRDSLSPKPRLWRPDRGFESRPYYQVFSDRMEFVPNLSAADLLFCEGPGAMEILRGSVR